MAGIRLTKFGGMLPLETPENLGKHMAVLAENTDLSRHTLRPWRNPRKVSGNTGAFLYKEACCEIVSTNCAASIADTQINCGLVIATGLQPYPVIATHADACAGAWARLGFPCDLMAPVASGGVASEAVPGGQKSQMRSYCYRLKNKFGQYSAPSYPSNSISLDAQNTVTVNLPTAFDPSYNITDIEVFALETTADMAGNKAPADWFSVAEVPAGTATVTDAYNELGDLLDSEDYDPPPGDLQDVQYWRTGQLAGLAGKKIVFSDKNRFQSWPASARHSFHDTPVALMVGSAIGFVATNGRPALIALNADCDAQSCHKVTDSLTVDPHPIVSKRSAVMHNDHGIWATKDGLLMISPNGATKLLTAKFYTQDQWRALRPETMIGAVHDGVYYGFTDEIGFRLHLPDNTYAAAYDTELTTLKFAQGKPTALYRSFTDELYLQFADGVYWWNEGADFMILRWHGAVFDLPATTAMTAYKVVHEHADVLVNHWADDELIDTENVRSIRPHRLPIANALNWQVEIETTGEVKEYHLATSVRDLSEGAA
jgi:hypothetical protein